MKMNKLFLVSATLVFVIVVSAFPIVPAVASAVSFEKAPDCKPGFTRSGDYCVGGTGIGHGSNGKTGCPSAVCGECATGWVATPDGMSSTCITFEDGYQGFTVCSAVCYLCTADAKPAKNMTNSQ